MTAGIIRGLLTPQHARQFLLSLALYSLACLPLYAVLGVIEGAVVTGRGLTVADAQYQLASFAVFFGPWLLVGGCITVPLLYTVLSRWQAGGRRARRITASLLGPVAFFVGQLGVAIIGTGVWWAPVIFLQLPVTFIAGPALYALVVEKLTRNESYTNAT